MTQKRVITLPYKPLPWQREAHALLKKRRFVTLVIHRRGGKSKFAIAQLVKSAAQKRGLYAYIAPLLNQARRNIWNNPDTSLRQFVRGIPGVKIGESDMSVDFPNGSRIVVLGADYPDAIRGMGLSGCVLDEVAQMPFNTWEEVVRPALSDHEGWGLFIGTPKGGAGNLFFDLYHGAAATDGAWGRMLLTVFDTGYLTISAAEVEQLRRDMSEASFAQEYLCSWTALLRGAYYAKLLDDLQTAGRITRVKPQGNVLAHTAWDLGIGDATAIVWWQQVGNEIHVLRGYEAEGEGLAHYASVLQQAHDRDKLLYGTHWLPHDAEARELGTGKSRRDVLRGLGIQSRIVPRLGVEDGIEAVRQILPRCWFDATHCAPLLLALRQYRRDENRLTGQLKDKPFHGPESHYADAFRYLALAIKNPQAKATPQRVTRPASWMAG